jgi:hypothetical protein
MLFAEGSGGAQLRRAEVEVFAGIGQRQASALSGCAMGGFRRWRRLRLETKYFSARGPWREHSWERRVVPV